MQLIGINFPNDTVSPGWYGDGRDNISILKFTNCSFNSVHPDAFKSTALTGIWVVNYRGISGLHLGPIHNHNYLGIWLEFTRLRSIDNTFLTPIRKTFRALHLQYFPNFEKSIRIFENRTFITLHRIYIIGEGNEVSRSLDHTTFGRMPTINVLHISFCGIEHIEPNTFAQMGRSLFHVELNDNKLKTVDPTNLEKFLDTYQKEWYHKHFLYSYNPLDCNCELLEIHVLTAYVNDKYKLIPLTSCDYRNPNRSCSLQSVSMRKLNRTCDRPCQPDDEFMYPRVDLRVSEDQLLVQTNYKLKFRLWIHRHRGHEIRKRSKCPTPEWLRNSVTCLMLPGANKTISITKYVEGSNLTTFMAILTIPRKRVFPLQVQTLNLLAKFEFEYPKFAVIVIGIGCGLVGILLGIVIGICYYYADKQENISQHKMFV